MSRELLRQIFSSDDKAVKDARGPLSILYRRILYDLGINAQTIEQQLERWIKDPKGPVKQTTKKITQARGNYTKKMIEPTMTWKSFMDLVMMLYPKFITIEVKLNWGTDKNGNPIETRHPLTMDTSYLSSPDEIPTFLSQYHDVITNYSTENEPDEDEDIYGETINNFTNDDDEDDNDYDD